MSNEILDEEKNDSLNHICGFIKIVEKVCDKNFKKNVWVNFEDLTLFWDAEIKKLSVSFDVYENGKVVNMIEGPIEDFDLSIRIKAFEHVKDFVEMIISNNEGVIYE